MTLKTVLIFLNILGLIGCLIWLITEPGWLSVIVIVGLIATLIAQLARGQSSTHGFGMSQSGGKGSTNYQSKGNITINNKPTTINHYGSTETMWIVEFDKPPISNNILEGSNSEYFLELVQPVFVLEEDGYITCLPENLYKLDILVNYVSKSETKFYANIFPDAENYLLHHLAHKDNVKCLGRPLLGFGNLKFQLTGTAPKEPGTYEREVNIGLLNFEEWRNSEVIFSIFYKFKLVVFSFDKNNGPYAESKVNPKTGVSFMVLNENNKGSPSQT